jgi:integrase
MKGKKVTLGEVDKKFVLGFVRYMQRTPTLRGVPLGPISIYTYYINLCIALNKAVKRELIEKNPCDSIPHEEKPQRMETHREYLTIEEIKKMIDTECKDVRVKRLFLFSCFTGLRYKDIFNLRWKNLVKVEDGVYQLEIVQQKTKKPLVVPLSANAMQWLPDRYMDGEENRIFQMPETSCAYDYLHDWSRKAGVRKNVTFHVGRHTYATLLLYYGADLYTVSKLLGHSNVRTTQIYAKVMDETKRKAVNLIPEIK